MSSISFDMSVPINFLSFLIVCCFERLLYCCTEFLYLFQCFLNRLSSVKHWLIVNYCEFICAVFLWVEIFQQGLSIHSIIYLLNACCKSCSIKFILIILFAYPKLYSKEVSSSKFLYLLISSSK